MKFSLDSFNSLSERERRLVSIGGAIAVLLLIFAIVLPLNRGVSSAEMRVATKQADLLWMRSVSSEIAASGPVGPAPATQESLLIVVDRAAREAGLGSALTSSEPSGQNGLRVRLEKAPFDTLVAWIARLGDQHGVTVESATVDNAGSPGLVNAGLVLRVR